VSPLVKISMHKAGGGTKQPVPYPLRLRQRRRFALVWISDAADKKKDRLGFAERFADEIVAVVEGKSSAWEKRSMAGCPFPCPFFHLISTVWLTTDMIGS
jgi:small subunit ribosomal protein S7